MNEKLLSTCSSQVEEGFRELEKAVKTKQSFEAVESRVFFVLDMVDSEQVDGYLKKWTLGEYYAGEIALDLTEAVLYLIKLYKRRGLEYNDDIRKFVSEIKANQQTNGRIMNEHGASLYSLSEFDSDLEAVQMAISYFLNSYKKRIESRNSIHVLSDTGLGLQALINLDYYRYKSEIQEIGAFLNSKSEAIMQQDLDETSKSVISDVQIPLTLISDSSFESKKTIESLLLRSLSEHLGSENSTNIWHLTRILHGLVASGEGPKISKYQSNWSKSLQSQRISRSKPQLVTTKPSTRLEERRREIYNKTKNMIKLASEEIRISTLRMDVLHDELIDRLYDDPELDVKILTSTGRPSGSNSKMKRAVMDEMIKRTEGNVREDELIHTRLVIADDQEALISSADLTRDQLNDEFNAGIYLKDPGTVQAAIDFFEDIWQEATPRDIN